MRKMYVNHATRRVHVNGRGKKGIVYRKADLIEFWHGFIVTLVAPRINGQSRWSGFWKLGPNFDDPPVNVA